MRTHRRPDVPQAVPDRRHPAALPAGLPNAALARVLMRQPAPAAPAPAPAPAAPAPAAAAVPQRPGRAQRGPNPAGAIAAVNARLPAAAPANRAAAAAIARRWAADAAAAVAAGAAASGAPHQALIAANERDEIRAAVDGMVADFPGLEQVERRPWPRFLRELRTLAEAKRQEVEIEFANNVIVETSRGQFGSYGGADLTALGSALEGMPVEATWGAPDPLHFKREPAGSGSEGGETDGSEITLYDAGMGPAPYERSRATGMAASMQTIRHEVGHTMSARLPPGDRQELFDRIMGWRRYSWAWITQPGQVDAWLAEQRRVSAETGLAPDALRTWLAGPGFAVGALDRSPPNVRGDRTYMHSRHQGDYLHSIVTAEMPQGPEFAYALSDKEEYVAELYSFATSRPAFLSPLLSAAQRRWWREKVFHMPGDDREVARQAGVPSGQESTFMSRVGGLFTWEQVDALVAELTAQAAAPRGSYREPPAD